MRWTLALSILLSDASAARVTLGKSNVTHAAEKVVATLLTDRHLEATFLEVAGRVPSHPEELSRFKAGVRHDVRRKLEKSLLPVARDLNHWQLLRVTEASLERTSLLRYVTSAPVATAFRATVAWVGDTAHTTNEWLAHEVQQVLKDYEVLEKKIPDLGRFIKNKVTKAYKAIKTVIEDLARPQLLGHARPARGQGVARVQAQGAAALHAAPPEDPRALGRPRARARARAEARARRGAGGSPREEDQGH